MTNKPIDLAAEAYERMKQAGSSTTGDASPMSGQAGAEYARAQMQKREGEIQHIGLPVHGYRPQIGDAIAVVNKHKMQEEVLLRQIESYEHTMDAVYDKRWLALARTHLQVSFMALNRAVFRPARVRLPEDGVDGKV